MECFMKDKGSITNAGVHQMPNGSSTMVNCIFAKLTDEGESEKSYIEKA